MAIIDHETMMEMGPTDETMPLRVVTPVDPRVDYPALERRMRWAGPFPVRRVETLGGRLSIRNPRMQDVPRDESPEGVEQSGDDTATFALPAVWKVTGKPSTNKLAHRSAASVQRVFNEAGWPIAVWYGETTERFWVMDENGLHEFETVTAMYRGMGWEAL